MWTQDNEIAAQGIEIAQMWSAMQLGAWAKAGTKLPSIVPITHPHREVPETASKATANPTAIAAMLGGR